MQREHPRRRRIRPLHVIQQQHWRGLASQALQQHPRRLLTLPRRRRSLGLPADRPPAAPPAPRRAPLGRLPARPCPSLNRHHTRITSHPVPCLTTPRSPPRSIAGRASPLSLESRHLHRTPLDCREGRRAASLRVEAQTPAPARRSGSAEDAPAATVAVGQSWRPALTDIIGARRAWTAAMIS